MPTSGSTSFSKSSTSISSGRRKPFLFLSSLLWRRKKVLEIGEIDDIIFDRNQRTRSEPSVISYNCTTSAMTSHDPQLHRHNTHHHHHPHSNKNHASTLTMTPGRCRDLDQDMHALRLSRQDNPFVQKVLASRESLIDTLDDQSDDAILMASEELTEDCSDPFTMPEVKEHMIRSPPPTTWPRSPQYMFTFNQENNHLQISDSEDDAYSNSSSNRAQDLFVRTTSVPEPSGVRSHMSNSIALSRPKSSSVNMSNQFGGLTTTGIGSSFGESQLEMAPASTSMILRPQCLFEDGTSVGRFN